MNDYKELIAKCDEWTAKADNLGADDFANHIVRCADAIERLMKERDTAIPDLRNIRDLWEYDGLVWHCSRCGKNPTYGMGFTQGKNNLFNYCPNCGARMSAEDNT